MKKVIAVLGAVALTLLIAATATAATVIGGGRSDTLRGTAGADVLYGKAGNDRLYGLGGNDRFYPGPGRDTIVCGKGKDTVFADAADVVGADCELIRRTQSPAPPAPSAVPVGTRANPYPVGTPVPLGDGWTMRVVGTTPNATAAVLAENMFNDPPAPGFQFFIVRVQATYTGQGSDSFDGSFRMRAVGSAAVSYSTFHDSCGVIPDEISDAKVFTGGTIAGNECWAVRNSDAGSLVMYDDPLLGNSATQKFFALR
jgi:Ca2+-binding RTX toxin-like protein